MGNSAFPVTGTAVVGSGVTLVDTGTGLSGGPITSTGTVYITNTAVTAGAYTNADITVNAQGQITAAANGTPLVPTSAGILGSSLNLMGSSTGQVGSSTASWTATQLIAWTALGGIAYLGSSLSLSSNLTTTGLNGMDTGTPPGNNDLYVYAIYNSTSMTWGTLATVAGAGANIYGGVNMPSGYDASCLIWTGKTYNFMYVGFVQQANQISACSLTAVRGPQFIVQTWALIILPQTSGPMYPVAYPLTLGNISAYVSINTKSVFLLSGANLPSGGESYSVASSASFINYQIIGTWNTGSNSLSSNMIVYNIPLPSAQAIYYNASTSHASGTTLRTLLWGWTF